MRNFFILEAAINYIEEHLYDRFSVYEVAKACCSSLSGLQKLFRYALHHSLKEYIEKRRLTKAAWDLVHSKDTVTQIAMRYQYNSPEVFSRAFMRLWNVKPSIFRETWHFSGLCPKLNYRYQEGDDPDMARKRVDISEAYEMFKQLEGTCVVCFDIIGLVPINDISREAGDKAILETARRIDSTADEDMLVLRIGGDEFALFTGKTETSEAEAFMQKVFAQNGQPILHEGLEIPLSVRAGITKIPEGGLRYNDLFSRMHQTIQLSREEMPI